MQGDDFSFCRKRGSIHLWEKWKANEKPKNEGDLPHSWEV